MFLYQKATALHSTHAQWDFVVRYNGDIYAINRSGSSGKTELHVLTAASDYQEFSAHVPTGLHATDASWVFGVNFDGDLFAINRAGASGKVEVHVLTASSNYQQFRVHAATALHAVNALWDLLIGPEDDLYAITRQGASGKTEVHVMRAGNSYSTMAFQTATGQHGTGPNWSFAVSANRDLCCALHQGASNTTELHVLTADSDYKYFGLHSTTGLHPIDSTWAIAAPQPYSVGFICRHGASGKTEIHVPALTLPSSSFQSSYFNLVNGMTQDEMIEMGNECSLQVGVWGSAGIIGGIPGMVIGGVAGFLSSIDCRNTVKEYLRARDHDKFEKMDKTNRDLERWEHSRNTAIA